VQPRSLCPSADLTKAESGPSGPRVRRRRRYVRRAADVAVESDAMAELADRRSICWDGSTTKKSSILVVRFGLFPFYPFARERASRLRGGGRGERQ